MQSNPKWKTLPRFGLSVVVAGFIWGQLGSSESVAAGLDTARRKDVVEFFQQAYLPDLTVSMDWSGNAAACHAGTTSLAYAEATIHRVNFFRAMAGLPGDVTLDPLQVQSCQEAALMMSAQGMLSHHPGTDWACYTAAGSEAARHSNLYLGLAGPAAIDGYIDDPLTKNYFVGHRRWILYPPQAIMATGSVPGESNRLSANCLWVLGPFGARPTQPDWVAWPPQGYVPYQIMPRASQRWSFSYAGADFSIARVSMEKDGTALSVVLEPQENNGGYADNTLVWVTRGIPSTPPPVDLSYSVTVSNVMASGQSRSFNYLVTIIDPDAGMKIITESLPEAISGNPYSIQLLASCGQPPYRWAVASDSTNLPAGVVLEEDGTLAGTAQAVGTFDFRVRVADADLQEVERQFVLSVRSSDAPVQILTASLPDGDAGPGSSYSVQLQGSGGLPPYTWSLAPDSGALPEGLILMASGRLVGSPSETGLFGVLIRLEDSRQSRTERSFQIFVRGPLQVVTTQFQDATAGKSYGALLEASGGRPPYSWSLAPSSGPLPLGLGISSAGMLKGVALEVGTFEVTLRVTDSEGSWAEQPVQVAVIEEPLAIASETLPDATVGLDYSYDLAAEAGRPPYAWSVETNLAQLPLGLSLDAHGRLSGRPQQVGVFPIVLDVTDFVGQHVQKALLLVVWAPALELWISSLDCQHPQRDGCRFSLLAEAPGAVVVEVSLDLERWEPLEVFFVDRPVNPVSDPNVMGSQVRFYRARHP